MVLLGWCKGAVDEGFGCLFFVWKGIEGFALFHGGKGEMECL